MSERNELRVKSVEVNESHVVTLFGWCCFLLFSLLVLCFSPLLLLGCCLLPHCPLWVVLLSPPPPFGCCLLPPSPLWVHFSSLLFSLLSPLLSPSSLSSLLSSLHTHPTTSPPPLSPSPPPCRCFVLHKKQPSGQILRGVDLLKSQTGTTHSKKRHLMYRSGNRKCRYRLF